MLRIFETGLDGFLFVFPSFFSEKEFSIIYNSNSIQFDCSTIRTLPFYIVLFPCCFCNIHHVFRIDKTPGPWHHLEIGISGLEIVPTRQRFKIIILRFNKVGSRGFIGIQHSTDVADNTSLNNIYVVIIIC